MNKLCIITAYTQGRGLSECYGYVSNNDKIATLKKALIFTSENKAIAYKNNMVKDPYLNYTVETLQDQYVNSIIFFCHNQFTKYESVNYTQVSTKTKGHKGYKTFFVYSPLYRDMIRLFFVRGKLSLQFEGYKRSIGLFEFLK